MVSGCCKDKCQDPSNPGCENYNPCHEKSFTADFQMYQEFKFKSNTYELYDWTDTTYRSEFFDGDLVPFYYYDNYVFVAKAKNVKSYQWKIGGDPRQRTESSFSIGFNGNEGTLSVSLIVELDPNDPCNKLKKKYDTVTKKFTIADELIKLPYIGNKYKIKNSLNNEERVIEFYKDVYSCRGIGQSFAEYQGPTIHNLIDSQFFIPQGFNNCHFCSNEIFIRNATSCFFNLNSVKNYNQKSTKGKISIKNDKISIEAFQLMHTIENNIITKKEKSPLIRWDGVKL